MTISMILRFIMICAGILLLCVDFLTFANRKFTELIGLGWGVFSVVLILLGAIPKLAVWSVVLCGWEYAIIYILFFMIIISMYLACISISLLIKKNQELAMQVSLLNQENEKILFILKGSTNEEKDTVCH